jgi:predicted small metal-binding protein
MKASCKDVSGINCSYVASGSSASEVKKALYDHAARAHSAVMAKVSEQQKAEMDTKMDQLLAMQK